MPAWKTSGFNRSCRHGEKRGGESAKVNNGIGTRLRRRWWGVGGGGNAVLLVLFATYAREGRREGGREGGREDRTFVQ